MSNIYTESLPQKAKEKALKARKKRKARQKLIKKHRKMNNGK